MNRKTYSNLKRIETFEDKFEYLKLGGSVGHSTFGFDRYINQTFYQSFQWKSVRDYVIIRDKGCDLGVEGYEIHSKLLVHHMTPLTMEDITSGSEWITDPEYLITTTHNTHNAIHYGDKRLLITPLQPRMPGDTKLW
jgi:hypothetical protein